MIQKIFDIENEGCNSINDIESIMNTYIEIIFLQFGISVEDTANSVINNISFKDTIPLEEIKIILDTIRDDFKEISDIFYFEEVPLFNYFQMSDEKNIEEKNKCFSSIEAYNYSLILSVYVTVCSMLNFKKTVSVESVRMELNSYETISFPKSSTSKNFEKFRENEFSQENNDKYSDFYLYKNIAAVCKKQNKKFALPKFLDKTFFCLLYYFKKISPEILLKEVNESKNFKTLKAALSKYFEQYSKIFNIIYDSYKYSGRDSYLLNDILALKTILPIHILNKNIHEFNNIRQSYELTDTLINSLASAMLLPVTYNYHDYIRNSLSALENCCTTLKYDIAYNKYQDNFYTPTGAERLNEWAKNLNRSIILFSDIVYPVISKAFFTVMYKMCRKQVIDSNNTTDILNKMKEKIEYYFLYFADCKYKDTLYENIDFNDCDIDGNNEEFFKLKKLITLSLYMMTDNSFNRFYKPISVDTFTLYDRSIYSKSLLIRNIIIEAKREAYSVAKARMENTSNFIDNAFNNAANINSKKISEYSLSKNEYED